MFRKFGQLASDKQGGSLVEILIVMAIFAIVSMGVVTSFVSSVGASKQGIEYAVLTLFHFGENYNGRATIS